MQLSAGAFTPSTQVVLAQQALAPLPERREMDEKQVMQRVKKVLTEDGGFEVYNWPFGEVPFTEQAFYIEVGEPSGAGVRRFRITVEEFSRFASGN
jgi:hypothetical protein